MEQAQRERRNHNETNGISHVPQWFVKTSKHWTFKEDYWTQRNDANFNELNLMELWWHASRPKSLDFFIVIYQQINFSYDFHTNRFFGLFRSSFFSNNQPHGLHLEKIVKIVIYGEEGENASGKLSLTELSFHYAWDHICVASFHDSCNHSIQCSFLNILENKKKKSWLFYSIFLKLSVFYSASTDFILRIFGTFWVILQFYFFFCP